MAKRPATVNDDASGSESGSDDVTLIDIDFEFFDPNPQVDYHAIKNLFSQLFQSDAELIQSGKLTDLVLSQPLVGTTVKTDGKEADPYALLTVLNMSVHRDHPSIQALTSYILHKASSTPELHAQLTALLAPQSKDHVGLVLSERLINMPVQIVPHMYRMLQNEIQLANEDNEPYIFSHYLFLTRTYRMTVEEAAAHAQAMDERDQKRRPKRRKNKISNSGASTGHTGEALGAGCYSFHPEDEIIQKASQFTLNYDLTTRAVKEERDAESFGLDIGGRLMVVPSERFEEMIQVMLSTFTT